MATAFVTASQVGSYFIAQYYHLVQQRPEFVHQLYSDASTMVRVDGQMRESAVGMTQIQSLGMLLRFSAIEIKSAHSVESYNGGVLVMVTGAVQIRDFPCRKKFAQTFFLAPQEKGYFVLSDIFHFIEDDPIHSYPATVLAPAAPNINAKFTASAVQEPVANYMMGGVQARDYIAPAAAKENGTVDDYSMPDQRLQQVSDAEHVLEDNSGEQTNGFLENNLNVVQEIPQQVEESVAEPQKHTYASVLRTAKGLSGPTVSPALSPNKNVLPASERNHVQQQTNQQTPIHPIEQTNVSFAPNENSSSEAVEDVSATDDRGEIKSVYVRNLSTTVSASEIEEEFKKFGKLSSEGVAIRRLKDTDVCYAFVEFEDLASVQDAIKAGSVQVAGRQVYIEERRANSSFARGRRGRGRGTHQPDMSRGRFGGGRGYGRSQAEYHRTRGGNSYYRQTMRRDRSYSGNGQSPPDSTA